jgi:hypothetical protein
MYNFGFKVLDYFFYKFNEFLPKPLATIRSYCWKMR